jgi:hypothetical protein
MIFKNRSTVQLGQLPGQLHFRESSCSVVTHNSFKFLGFIQVIDGYSESLIGQNTENKSK